MKEMQLNEEQSGIAQDIAAKLVQDLIVRFGQLWVDETSAPSSDAGEVDRLRDAYIMPLATGVHLALARFLWATAPPGTTIETLVEHLTENAPLIGRAAAMQASEHSIEAGHFWTQLAEQGH